MIAAVASSCTRRYAEKQSTSDAVAFSQGQREQKSDETVLAHEQEKPQEYKKLVVLRVAQITGSHYNRPFPLILLENDVIISNWKSDMQYLLKPGDTVLFLGDQIIGYNLKD